jgi:rRNA-processing protein FCF1
VENKQIKALKTEKHKNADRILQEIADKDTIVATQDKALKKALKTKDIKTIAMRQQQYLIIEG